MLTTIDTAAAFGRIVLPAVRILVEQPADIRARETLLDEAFGPARFLKTCQRLRDGRRPARGLSLVAKVGDEVVGTIRLWHVEAGGVPALMLGPLAVSDRHRSRGIGAKLMREAISRAARFGHRAILLVGDAPYYAPFGFDGAATRNLQMPGPVETERFLALELVQGALADARGLVVATGAAERAATFVPLSHFHRAA